MSGAIDGQRCAGSALSPRRITRRIQVGTSRSSGSGRSCSVVTLTEKLSSVARERALAVERLVERDAEAELIGPLVGALADDLLGRHVRGRPDPVPVLVSVASACVAVESRSVAVAVVRAVARLARQLVVAAARLARESEVDDARAPVLVQQHVVGLEVAVHQPGRVRGRQPAPGRDEDVEHLAPGARLGARASS